MTSIIKGLLVAGIAITTCNTAEAQFGKKLLDRANAAVNNNNTGNNNGGNFTNNEAVAALKEALQVGTRNASGRLNAPNGFFGNQLIKILMPPEARQMETTLRGVGLGGEVDKVILTMNRAAEDASGQVVQIFINAISGMSVQDGISIVRGGQGAATNFLKQRTTQELTNSFRPIIQSSLGKTGATRYWTQIFTTYNRMPMVSKINPDLTAYVTERALSGLFVTIADEENKIRLNPAARVSDLLKKVFGG